MDSVLLVFVFLLLIKTAAEIVLDLLNRKEVRRFSEQIPAGLEGVMDDETYRKAVDYTLAKNGFSLFNHVYGAAILAVVILSGFLPWLYSIFHQNLGTALWAEVLFLITASILISIPGLPLEWWGNFGWRNGSVSIKARSGFGSATRSKVSSSGC